tara:strand:+ start:129 stop:632 length:504 start_codon:yes stop_codon:yes gene_type:complete
MSGLLFCTNEDFFIQNIKDQNILSCNINGFTFLLFYSNQCKHCKNLVPIFKSLPGTIGGCKFGMINISKNKEIIKKSMNSTTEIKYVPLMILYIDGKPFMRYDGPLDKQSILEFIVNVANSIQDKQNFSDNKEISPKKQSIPEYCIGRPLCGKNNKCYVKYDNAYQK